MFHDPKAKAQKADSCQLLKRRLPIQFSLPGRPSMIRSFLRQPLNAPIVRVSKCPDGSTSVRQSSFEADPPFHAKGPCGGKHDELFLS